ncbi:MAG: hypothetical protein OXU20_31670 [Myxococcales bacterium]|nr:hypothetical protein [Myxococcales bacterium]MDD9964675.1 hypothetical protein [Myxococcales bacterium]
MLLVGALRFLGPLHAPVAADEALQMGARTVLRDHHQVVFVVRRGDAGHGAHLAVAELTAREGSTDLWQVRQGAGDAHPFTGGPKGDAALPVEPVGGALEATVQVTIGAIEALEEHQEPVLGGIEVPGQLRERVLLRVQVLGNVGLSVGYSGGWVDMAVKHTLLYCSQVQVQASNLT